VTILISYISFIVEFYNNNSLRGQHGNKSRRST
ncbi:MAG: hypothetical protein ACI9TV_000219, partial [Sulfurimonas sp.]